MQGQAKVESKKGYIEIEVEFENLQKPTTFGNEYLTYVLWAISPEGRAVNLGEVLLGSNQNAVSNGARSTIWLPICTSMPTISMPLSLAASP